MSRFSLTRLLLTLLICTLIWAAVAIACLCVGSTGIGWPTHEQLPLRRDPVLIASLVGAALAAAGVVYQAVLRNPLAEPYLLGVSGGATLATYLWALPLGAAPAFIGGISQQAFAFAGALAAVACVLALSQRRGRLDPITMLLVGVIVNAISGATYLLLYHLNLRSDATAQTGGQFRFLVGGIQTNLTTAQELSAALFAGVGWVILASLAGPLAVAPLGEDEAEALGVRIQRLRWTGMIVASLVTASAVAVSGPIGFVGLICPHVGRLIVGPDPRRLFPVSTALGAILLVLADAATRTLSGQHYVGTLLPVGVLTGMLGGPFFLFLLWRREASR